MCFAYPWISSVRNSFIRPVAERGAGRAPAPPEIFKPESNSATKNEKSTKMDSCQRKLKFQNIVDHCNIMYYYSSVQFGIV